MDRRHFNISLASYRVWPMPLALMWLLLCLPAGSVHADPPVDPPAAAPSQAPVQTSSDEDVQTRIEAWVIDLSSQEYATRRRAFLALWKQGRAALPAVRRALTTADQQTINTAKCLRTCSVWISRQQIMMNWPSSCN